MNMRRTPKVRQKTFGVQFILYDVGKDDFTAADFDGTFRGGFYNADIVRSEW